MMPDPKSGLRLSVLLVAYNHESYIDRALDSLIQQDYTGPIELVIADDASTDNTLERIRAYEGVDTRFTFKYLSSDTNIGITKNYQRGFAACSGTYVAVLEGDDYWISPRKLSRQTQFLSEHWECDLCSVNYFIFYQDSAIFTERTEIGSGHRLISARQLIADNLVGNFSTCMYRKSALDDLPAELFEVKSYDWIVNICVASKSLIGFIEEPMSVYRIHSSGAWSNFASLDKLQLQLSLIPTYDRITLKKYHLEFNRLEHDLRNVIVLAKGDRLAGDLMRPTILSLTRLRLFIPPVMVTLFHALVPPILTRLLLKVARWGRI